MPTEIKGNSFYSSIETNPAGTHGFAFLEFAAETPDMFRDLFSKLNFVKIATHKTKAVELWQQSNIVLIINCEPNSFATQFYKTHGPSVCGMGFKVNDSQQAFMHCMDKDAKAYDHTNTDWFSQTQPTIYGIGDSLLYLVGKSDNIFADFDTIADAKPVTGVHALNIIDHVTHNVFRGNMDKWAQFYEKLFNFHQIRYFDITGKMTGLVSRAMTSPCGNIKIPINESSDDKSQIAEYLDEYNGEGIQHIAMTTHDIYQTVEVLREGGMDFMPTPDTYYRGIEKRLPHHKEPLERMHKNQILIDGDPDKDGGLLLQIFTKTVIGPVFFEIIQRKGDEGFGEGNFQALFESIELDQIERGVLKEDNS